MVLAFVGFVIIAVVVVVNHNKSANTSYEIESSYIPTQRSDLLSSKELYDQLTGARRLTCPVITMSKSSDKIITLTSIWGSYYDHPYQLKNLFITNSRLSDDDTIINPSNTDYKDVLKLNQDTSGQCIYTSDTVSISSLFSGDKPFNGEQYIELISPFNFRFENLNSANKVDEDTGVVVQDIVIVNVQGNCRITFGNVANWFCAGPVGTAGIKSNGSDGTVPWEKHYDAHHSVIGNTSNAICSGGVSGEVIGYAKSGTTITIEVFENGSFKKVSFSKFITPSSTD